MVEIVMGIKQLYYILKRDKGRYAYSKCGIHTFWFYLIPFRIANFMYINRSNYVGGKNSLIYSVLYFVCILYYRFVEHIYSIQISPASKIGAGLKFAHYCGIVVSASTVIGENCTLHQNCTLGNSFSKNSTDGIAPIVGNNVIIFPSSVIVGHIRIGDNAIICAGSVVIKDVPENAIVAGNPAKVICNDAIASLSEFGKQLYRVDLLNDAI